RPISATLLDRTSLPTPCQFLRWTGLVPPLRAGKRVALPLPPPQRTVRATFTAYSSSTAKVFAIDTGLAIPHKPFAFLVSSIPLTDEMRALSCNEAASSKLPSFEPLTLPSTSVSHSRDYAARFSWAANQAC